MSGRNSHAQRSQNKINDSDLAYIDDLTGLYNRRYLNTMLSKEISKVKKHNKKLVLFMMDCDDLKDVNDTYGHLNGDRVLIEIAGILKKKIGKTGIVVRYAGDEFTVALPGMKLKKSLKIADSLLRLTSECKIALKDGKRLSNVSLSIGAAVYPDDADSTEGLIDKADQALYSAKRTGKNKVSTIRDLTIEVHNRSLLANALPCKKFVGREKESELLEKSYNSAEKGAKKFVLIEGERGIGKTRLILELLNLRKTEMRLLLQCRKNGLEQQFSAISDALNGFLDFLGAREVLDVLASLSDINKYALSSTVDKIKHLPIRYSKDMSSSVKELREGDIFSAFINFIKELRLKNIPVLIDDILWIDKGSLRVIKWILEEASAGALVAGTVSNSLLRTQVGQKTPFADFLNDKKTRKISEEINLRPLTEDAVSEFLKAVFSGPLLPSDIEKKISRMSLGIPSNIEEIIRYLLDNKIVYPKGGKWILDKKHLDRIPPSLESLLQKHIFRFEDEKREIRSKAAIAIWEGGFDIDVFTKSFFDRVAKELIESKKPKTWAKKSIDNLRPLTEALIIKDDLKTIKRLIESLLDKVNSHSPSLRISAADGLGKVSEVLLEKEIFDISAIIGTELSKCLKSEENFNVYVRFLNVLEIMINMLVQKHNLFLLLAPLTAMKEELTLSGQRPAKFRRYAAETIDRILNPENMEVLMFSFRKKAKKDYLPIINLMAQLGERTLKSLIELLRKKDDLKSNSFKKRWYMALIIKGMKEKAIRRLANLLNDKRLFVVRNVIEVLGYINDKRYLFYLEQAAKHPDEKVQKEAMAVIRKLRGQH